MEVEESDDVTGQSCIVPAMEENVVGVDVADKTNQEPEDMEISQVDDIAVKVETDGKMEVDEVQKKSSVVPEKIDIGIPEVDEKKSPITEVADIDNVGLKESSISEIDNNDDGIEINPIHDDGDADESVVGEHNVQSKPDVSEEVTKEKNILQGMEITKTIDNSPGPDDKESPATEVCNTNSEDVATTSNETDLTTLKIGEPDKEEILVPEPDVDENDSKDTDKKQSPTTNDNILDANDLKNADGNHSPITNNCKPYANVSKVSEEVDENIDIPESMDITIPEELLTTADNKPANDSTVSEEVDEEKDIPESINIAIPEADGRASQTTEVSINSRDVTTSNESNPIQVKEEHDTVNTLVQEKESSIDELPKDPDACGEMVSPEVNTNISVGESSVKGVTNEEVSKSQQKLPDIVIKKEVLDEQYEEQHMSTSQPDKKSEETKDGKEVKTAAPKIKIKEEKEEEPTNTEKTTNRMFNLRNIVSRLVSVGTKSKTVKEHEEAGKKGVEDGASTSTVSRHGKGDHTEHVRKSPGAVRKMPILSPIKKENEDIIVVNDDNSSMAPANQQSNLCSNCCEIISAEDVRKWTKSSFGQQLQFCSNACMNINPFKSPFCSLCKKDMKKGIQDMKVSAPSGPGGRFLDFCTHACVILYEERKNAGTHCYCTVCSSLIMRSRYKHSLKLKGRLFRLCSTDCQKAFMKDNHVQPVKICYDCKTRFTQEGVTAEVKGVKQMFCSTRCHDSHTKKTNLNFTNCLICKKINTAKDLSEVEGTDGEKYLVCTGLCVTRLMHRLKTRNISILPRANQNSKSYTTLAPGATVLPSLSVANQTQQEVITTITNAQTDKSGMYATAPVNCNHCNTYQAPLYHLTMSDNTVRNFCSYPCVIGFQSQFNMPPVTLPQEELKLHCKYCKKNFNGKPVTLSWKNDVHFFCSENCSATYKKTYCVIIMCDNCSEERIHHSTIYFSGKERNFCSEGCHLLYKQSFTQKLGLRWCICDYCSQIGPTAFETKSEGHTIKFCSKKCREKYDQWQKQLVKCEGCKQQGRLLRETFMWRGEVKKVCNQLCLLLFYTQQNLPNMLTEVQQNIPNGKQPTTVASALPVISNVFSFASNQNSTIRKKPAVEMVTKQTQITTTPVQPKVPTLPALPIPKQVRNKMTLCKPIQQTKSTNVKPLLVSKQSNTEEDWRPKLVVVPIPVPIYIPVPMQMYTTPVPHPIGIPTPVPVPMFLPVSTNNADKLIQIIKDIKKRTPSDPLEAELLAMANAIADEDVPAEKDETVDLDLFDMDTTEIEIPEDVLALLSDVEEVPSTVEPNLDQADIRKLEEDILALSASTVDDTTSILKNIEEKVDSPDSEETTSRSTRSGRHPTKAEVKQLSPSKKRRRTSQRSTRKKRLRVESDSEEEEAEEDEVVKVAEKVVEDRHYSIGIGAYKLWVVKKNAELKQKLQPGGKAFSFKEDILTNTSDELSYTLCHFVKEARQPNGEEYPQPLVYYILLAIQHYLFNSGHPDNILTDLVFARFMQFLVERVRTWEPVFKPDTSIVINSHITEELMWECKQLGAHSPYVLLNTLVYFNTKFFLLKTVKEHEDLLFGMMFKDWKKSGVKNKVVCLRYFPAKMRKKLEETTCKIKKRSLLEKHYLEQSENFDDPLQCPVKLYEFYLSKCPETVKGKQNSLYLIPERLCIPDSPVWYSSRTLKDDMLEKMLTKALMVKDIHEYWAQKEQDEVADDGDDDDTPYEEES